MPVADAEPVPPVQAHAKVPARTRSPRLHPVCYLDKAHRYMAYTLVSAEAHGLYTQVIGFGEKVWWPDGLGAKINALRRFVMRESMSPKDIVLFLDVFDIIVFAGEEEIVSKFLAVEQKYNKSLFFNAEEYCFPKPLCQESEYPESTTRWRYLNSGLMIGRVGALRQLLKEEVPATIVDGDQTWYQERFIRDRDSLGMTLDTRCEVICALVGADESFGAVIRSDKRITVLETGTKPAVVHFNGVAHWPEWKNGRGTNRLHQVFQELYPEQSERLLDTWHLQLDPGPTFDSVLYHGEGFWTALAIEKCMECRFWSLGNECQYFPSLLARTCWPFTALAISLLFSAIGILACLMGKWRLLLLLNPRTCAKRKVDPERIE